MELNFDATPELLQGHLILRLPQPVSDQLPSRGLVMSEITIDSIRHTLPLEPDGKGGHWLLLDGLQLQAGSPLKASLAMTDSWPEPDMPEDITAGIRAAGLEPFWNGLTVRARWEWLRWIRATNVSATREKRIVTACSKMTSGMRRPCCFNAASCTVPELSRSGVLMDA